MLENVSPQAAIIEIIVGFALGYFVPLLLLKWYIARLRRQANATRQPPTESLQHGQWPTAPSSGEAVRHAH